MRERIILMDDWILEMLKNGTLEARLDELADRGVEVYILQYVASLVEENMDTAKAWHRIYKAHSKSSIVTQQKKYRLKKDQKTLFGKLRSSNLKEHERHAVALSFQLECKIMTNNREVHQIVDKIPDIPRLAQHIRKLPQTGQSWC